MEFAQRELENNNQTEIKIICVTPQTRFIIVKQGQNVDYVIRSCLTGFLFAPHIRIWHRFIDAFPNFTLVCVKTDFLAHE